MKVLACACLPLVCAVCILSHVILSDSRPRFVDMTAKEQIRLHCSNAMLISRGFARGDVSSTAPTSQHRRDGGGI